LLNGEIFPVYCHLVRIRVISIDIIYI